MITYLNLPDDFYSSSPIQSNSKSKSVTVKAKSFNEEIRRINPTFLIIDIEGGEYELSQYADFYNVKKILVEVHPHVIGSEKVELFKNKLTQSGFQIDNKLSTGDIWFLEREKLT
jgi:hypothetical protein